MPEHLVEHAMQNRPDPAQFNENDGALMGSAYNSLAEQQAEVHKAIVEMRNAGNVDAETMGKMDELLDKAEMLGTAMKAELRAQKVAREYTRLANEGERFAAKAEPAVDGAPADDVTLKAFEHYLRTGLFQSADPDVDEALKAIQASTTDMGGYTITPTVVSDRVEAVLENMVFMNTLATKHRVQPGQAFRFPRLSVEFLDANWVAENNAGTEETTGRFDALDITPQRLVKWIKESRDVVNNPATNVVSFVEGRLAYMVAITIEKSRMTGAGGANTGGIGIFIASNNGISTSRDQPVGVAWNATSTTDVNAVGPITPNSMVDMVYGITAAYRMRPTVRWVVGRENLKLIRKLRDQENNYMWQPGLRAGEPSLFLGYPMMESEYAPGAITANGQYPVVFGDMSQYHVAQARPMEVLRSDHRFIEEDNIYFAIRCHEYGAPVIEEGFIRLKTGTS